MKIFLGADHAGFKLKEGVKAWLKHQGFTIFDEGAFEYDEDDDYPDFVQIVANQVASEPDGHRGLAFGGSGQGEAMTANRVPGVRAAVFYGGPDKIVLLSRWHNNANVLAFGARFLTLDETLVAVKLWLQTEFPGEERHVRRIGKIDRLWRKSSPQF